ncbi:MAG: hypothetical protein ACUVTU_06135 [Desulfurispora sp.]|uniref:hypothetical protein n=1 Tax=Desulfurispora sp. TaxID=3014275 RepID=UPI00404972DA
MPALNSKPDQDYRFNFAEGNRIISMEIKCCGQHIGELRFRDGESCTCPVCRSQHKLRMDYNHFHVSKVNNS